MTKTSTLGRYVACINNFCEQCNVNSFKTMSWVCIFKDTGTGCNVEDNKGKEEEDEEELRKEEEEMVQFV